MNTKPLITALCSILIDSGGAPLASAAPAPVSGHFARVGDLGMYYEVHGQRGEPLVVIHGGGSTISTSFGQILPLLANSSKVIAVELQGHGHTPDRPGPESFEQDADDVAALLRQLHIPKASLFGFSNGGSTAMQVAIRHPDRVNKLIVASAFYKREGLVPNLFENMRQATLDVMPQPLKDAFVQINPDPAKLLRMFNKDRQRMLDFVDWKDDTLRSIHVPTLIINGDQDVVLTEHAIAMSRLIARSRLMVLPATHGSYLGAAEATGVDPNLVALTAYVVSRFLSDTEREN